MPITINGSGTVTGISAGGLPDACITTDDLAANAASGLAKAWVNFDGTFATSPFTIANGGIRASFNVSSITDNGTGDYTVNFTTAMADANYAVNVSQGGTGGIIGSQLLDHTTPRTSSLFRIIVFDSIFALANTAQLNVAVFR